MTKENEKEQENKMEYAEGYVLPLKGLPYFFKGRRPRVIDIYKTLKPTDNVVFFGQTKSGKTTAMLELLKQLNLPRLIAMILSPAIEECHSIPLANRFSYFSSLFLMKLMDYQRKIYTEVMDILKVKALQLEGAARVYDSQKLQELAEKFQQQYKNEKNEKVKEKAWINEKKKFDLECAKRSKIRDDYIEQLKQAYIRKYACGILMDEIGPTEHIKSAIIKILMCTSRHYWAPLLFAIQNFMDFPSRQRSNIMWIVFFYDVSKKNLAAAVEHYLSNAFETTDELKMMMNYVANVNKSLKKGRYCTVVNPKCTSPDKWEHVYLFYVPEPERSMQVTMLGDPIAQWLSNLMVDFKKLKNPKIEEDAAKEERDFQKNLRSKKNPTKS